MQPRERLILVAASGLAREVIDVARVANTHEIIGVVDDNPATHGSDLAGVPVLGGLDVVNDVADAQIVLCAGQGSVRESISNRLAAPASRFATIVHPGAAISPSCVLGHGSIVLAGVVCTASVRVGRHVVIMPNVNMTHDTAAADYVTLCAGVTLGGGVRIGERAYVGMAVSVRQNAQVGPDCIVGMGSVVLESLPAGETWFGVPARRQLSPS